LKLPIDNIDIRFFVHATEDPEKVMQAVRCLTPANHFEDVKFQKRELKGHFGNPITLVSTRIKEVKILEGVIKRLTSLNKSDKEKITREPRLFIEKNSLYLRFDKQFAFSGTLQLKKVDPIYVRIRFKASGKKIEPEEIVETSKEIGLIA
jgi:RNA binding exosome subunit